MTPAERVLNELDSSHSGFSAKRLRLWLVSAAIVVFYAESGRHRSAKTRHRPSEARPLDRSGMAPEARRGPSVCATDRRNGRHGRHRHNARYPAGGPDGDSREPQYYAAAELVLSGAFVPECVARN